MPQPIKEDAERQYTSWIEIDFELFGERGSLKGLKAQAYRNKGGLDNWRWEIECARNLGTSHRMSSSECYAVDEPLFKTAEDALEDCVAWITENISFRRGFLVIPPDYR